MVKVKVKHAIVFICALLLTMFLFWTFVAPEDSAEVDMIFTGPYTASVAMPVEVKDKFIFQIGQLHLVSTSSDNDPTHMTKVIETQRNIAALITEIKKQSNSVLVCPEGVPDIASEIKSWDEDITPLNNFRRQVEHALRQKDFVEVKELYDSLTSAIERRYTGAIRQQQLLLAQETIIMAANSENLALPQEAGIPTHPFGRDVKFIVGAVPLLYQEGAILKTELVACEDEAALLRMGEVIAQAEEGEVGSEKFHQANVEREEHIVKNAAQALNATRSVDNIVLVLGAMHDLTERIENHNRANGTNFGYIYLLPKPLTEEYLKKLIE